MSERPAEITAKPKDTSLNRNRLPETASYLRQEVDRLEAMLIKICSGPQAEQYQSDLALRKLIAGEVWHQLRRRAVAKPQPPDKKPSPAISTEPVPTAPMAKQGEKVQIYYSFEKVLKELQIEEDELQRLVDEGEIRAFRDEGKMKFKKSDIEGLEKGRMTEPIVILPSGESEESVEDSEVLLVEEDASETLLSVDDATDEGGSGQVPTVDFTSAEPEMPEPAPLPATITDKLTFEEDSGSYVLESADDVCIDSSQELVPVDEGPSGGETSDDIAPKPVVTDLRQEAQQAQPPTAKSRLPVKPSLPVKPRLPEIPAFEKLLSDEAGRPGPIERLVAQSLWLMKTLQVTLGLTFIPLANAVDIVVDTVTSYVGSIFQTWKLMRTVRRRLARNTSEAQLKGMAEDFLLARVRLSRLLSLAGSTLATWEHQPCEAKAWQAAMQATFALKLALELRGHLDEMKRDLSLLTAQQFAQFMQKSFGDFIKSLIPNPIGIFSPWKDWIVMVFWMRYSRREVETMCANLLTGYQNMRQALETKHFQQTSAAELQQLLPGYARQLTVPELALLARLDKPQEPEGIPLEIAIEETRHALQRLIQMLCCPAQFVYPQRWRRVDLFQELGKTDDIGQRQAHVALEAEAWLTRAVAEALRRSGVKPDLRERELRWQEAKELRTNTRIAQRLHQQFLW